MTGKTFLNLIETIEIKKDKNPGISVSLFRQLFVRILLNFMITGVMQEGWPAESSDQAMKLLYCLHC